MLELKEKGAAATYAIMEKPVTNQIIIKEKSQPS